MIGERVRRLREGLGLTQAELAQRAGVSRQLVGALEAGRNLPRVDAALSLGLALGVDVASLFAQEEIPQDLLSGDPPASGSLLKVGMVGDRIVTSPSRAELTGWDVADATIESGALERFVHLKPGLVVAGCEPGLELLERWLREAGMGAVAANCSTAAALVALQAERVHAAVVHAPADRLPERPADVPVARFQLCQWQVGLAAPREAASGWIQAALSGRTEVIQREAGAGVQAAFQTAAESLPGGPRVGSHLEAARMGVATGTTAVTIEPAALAVEAQFHPLEVHTSELWVAEPWLTEPAVEAALVELSGKRFQRHLERVGGYDLEGCGSRSTE